jgi:phosphoglucosamine mutase
VRKLFGTDGIRGVAGQWPLTPEYVRRIGHAAGTVLRERLGGRPRTLLVVRDTRASGPALLRALAAGLGAAGFRTLDGGVLPTASVAALVPRRRLAGGAVVSASHNPAAFNGIKFFGPAGRKLSDAVEHRIEARLFGGDAAPEGPARTARDARAASDYLAFLRGTWPSGRSLRGLSLVLDCANGAAYRAAPALFRSLGARVRTLADRPDGRNINRGCGALHPERLAREVLRRRADLGVAFDGDADRAMFVDETGAVRDGDSVLLAAARHLRARGRLPGGRVVVTVMANLGLHRALRALGLRAVETPVGDRYVWEAMERTGAALGGEPSGHVIFRRHLSTGDGLLTALQVLEAMVSSGRPLSALSALVVKHPQVLVNVPVKERRPLEGLREFRRGLAALERELGNAGRVFVRYSGTEPLLRIMVEGPDHAFVRRRAEDLARAVRRDGL